VARGSPRADGPEFPFSFIGLSTLLLACVDCGLSQTSLGRQVLDIKHDLPDLLVVQGSLATQAYDGKIPWSMTHFSSVCVALYFWRSQTNIAILGSLDQIDASSVSSWSLVARIMDELRDLPARVPV
jgi:hypothetical protein